MRTEGTIKSWNDSRGFGFISPTHGDAQIFAHISNFPKNSPRPSIGEKISFEIITDETGKKKAINIIYLNRSRLLTPQKSFRKIKKEKTSSIKIIALIIMALVLVYMYNLRRNQHESTHMDPIRLKNNSNENSQIGKTYKDYKPLFKCDGRQHCTEMTSCEEAKFFSSNCSDTKMDGDMDGIPCEDQWCS